MAAITEDAAREAAGRETAKLYRSHGSAIYRYALHTLGSREDAEDVTQATFASAHAALARGTKVREPRAWLFRIAHHECVGRITERRARPVVLDGELDRPDDGASVDRTFQAQRTVRDVMAAVSALPAQQRDALVLREWSGLSVTEVAAALDSSVPAVNALLHRARRSVLATVAGHDEAAGCTHTRDCLEANKLDLAARAHLVRCAECRGLRRTVLPQPAGGFAIVPPAILAERLADLIPGFAAGGGGAGAMAIGSGTGIAAILGKAAALPTAAKVTAAVVASAVAVGGSVEGVREIERHGGDIAPIEAASAADDPGGGGATTQSTSAATTAVIAATSSSTASAPETGDDHSGRGRGGDDVAGDDHSGRGSGGDDGATDDRSGKGGGDDGAGDDRSGKGGGDDGAEADDRSGKGGGDDAKADDGFGSGSGTSGEGGGATEDDKSTSTSSGTGSGGGDDKVETERSGSGDSSGGSGSSGGGGSSGGSGSDDDGGGSSGGSGSSGGGGSDDD